MNWPKEEPKNIVVRMPNWLGDAVMATPILEDLRNKYKEARLSVVCQKNITPLLQGNPYIDEILSFKKPNGWIRRLHHIEIIEPLRCGKFDLGVLLTNSFSSAWQFFRGHVQNRLGYTGHFRRLLLNKAVDYPKNIEKIHLVNTYKMLLEPLGITPSNTAPKLYVTDKELIEAKEHLRKLGVTNDTILVGINPGAAYGSAKCWLPERFREVTKKLLNDPNIIVVFFGDPSGAKLVNDICDGMPDRVINLAAKTNLRELIALIKCCKVFLTNDSGPMHIASALGVPLLALFGSTNDVATGPYANGLVIHKHVECSPCYKRVCPIDFRCMTGIGVDEVYNKLKQMIK